MTSTGPMPKRPARHYSITKKTAGIIKAFCIKDKVADKYQLSSFTAAENFVDWHKDSRKDDYYTSDEGMHGLLFSSQQPKAKDFRKHCCNVLFPHVRQQLTNNMKEDHQQTITGQKASACHWGTWAGNCIPQRWSTGTRQQDTGYPLWEHRFTRQDKSKGSAHSCLAKTLCRLSFKWR